MGKNYFHIKNIIFDMDGTLVDSKKDIVQAQLKVLQDFGITNFSEEDFYPHLGKSLDETFENFLPLNLHTELETASQKYAQYYIPNSLNTTKLFPNILELLQIMKRNNFKMAIASTKKGSGILRAVNFFELSEYFDLLQGSDNIPFKPDPTIINLILEKLNWDKNETLIVGDTDKDIYAGKNATVSSCGVTWGAKNFEELKKYSPEIIINSPLELIRYLIP